MYYANSENFVYKIIKLSEVDPYDVLVKITKRKLEHQKLVKKLKEQSVNEKNFKICIFFSILYYLIRKH